MPTRYLPTCTCRNRDTRAPHVAEPERHTGYFDERRPVRDRDAALRVLAFRAGARFAAERFAVDFFAAERLAVERFAVDLRAADFFAVERFAVDFFAVERF